MMNPIYFITVAVLVSSVSAIGPAPVNLGTAGQFAILSKSGVSTVPSSVIVGDVGVSPISQSALTGFSLTEALPPTEKVYTKSTQVIGKLYASNNMDPTPSKLTTAVSDMLIAYTDAAGRTTPDHVEYEGGALGGKTLAPGLYKFSSSVGFASDCTLSGSPTDTWIFQIAGDMRIAAAMRITLAGGARAKNVFWQVAGKTTFGADSHFEGIILGATSAEFLTGSSINGRVLVQTAVTLDQTTVHSDNRPRLTLPSRV